MEVSAGGTKIHQSRKPNFSLKIVGGLKFFGEKNHFFSLEKKIVKSSSLVDQEKENFEISEPKM